MRTGWAKYSAWLPLSLLGLVAVAWTIQNEIVHASVLVGNAVPAITALSILLVLSLIGMWGYRGVTREGFPLRVYLLMAIASAICGIASMSYLFAGITLPQYLRGQQEGMAHIASAFPFWYAPSSGEAIREYFEGNGTGAVPWREWALPLLTWAIFLIVLLLTLHALLSLLRSSWMEGERLAYPMVQIPLRLIGGGEGGSFWTSRLFWLGFGITATFDGANMLHAFFPEVPALDTSFNIGVIFTDRPWSSLAPFMVSYRPEIFGLAYLMPTDVLFTTWFSYVALRLVSVLRVALGEGMTSTSYDYQEFGIGAFLCLFVLLLWRAAPYLKDSLKTAVIGATGDSDEPLSARAAWGWLVGGTVFMLCWLTMAGLPLWLATAHLTLLIAVAVVYARMRAEAGAPMVYLFPFGQQQTLLLNACGSHLLAGGTPGVLGTLTSLAGLSRGYYPEVCAYSAEGMSLAKQAQFPQRLVTQAVIVGVLLGVLAGGYLHLQANYLHGAILLGRNPFQEMTGRYNGAIQMMGTATLPKPGLFFQTLLGGGIILLLSYLRTRLPWFPFHPMGFAMASSYGFHLWGPFLAAWSAKTLILRFGGLPGYRRLMPLFLGVALGRYLFGGIIWGLLGFFGHPATESFQLQFG